MPNHQIQAVEDYLSEIGKIRATHAGTGETSYYPPLSGLLNAIGETLSPKVRCVIQHACGRVDPSCSPVAFRLSSRAGDVVTT